MSGNTTRIRPVAKAASALFLFFSTQTPATSASDSGYVSSDCTVELSGSKRPMYNEKEMKLFDKSFAECMKLISNHDDGDSDFEYIEVESQDWRTDTHDRGRKRELRSSNRISTRIKCRRCNTETLAARRRLEYEDGVEGNPFDVCMETLFADKATGESNLAALDISGTVFTRCTLNVEHDPPIADVLGENVNGSDIHETQICTTEIAGATDPMLAEAEMAHFDRCMISEYNKIYGHFLGTHMVENEICEQDPSGGASPVPDRWLRGQTLRRLGSRNTVQSRSGSCRRCKSDSLYTRRRLSDLQLNADFNENFCACLMDGSDHLSNETYRAFAGNLVCTTTCDAPVPTITQLEAQAVETRSSFEGIQAEKRLKFEKEYEDEKKRLEKAEVEHKLKLDKFNFKEKEDQLLFEMYQATHYQEQLGRIRSQCIIPKTKLGQCDDIRFPSDMIRVTEAKTVSAKFVIEQKFAMDPMSRNCIEGRPGFEDIHFLARFAKEESEDGQPQEYDCKYEKKKCGESVQYEAKFCRFDNELIKMVADLDISFDRLDLVTNGSARRGRELVFSSARELEDDDMCLKAKENAQLGIDNTCLVQYMIDCNCAVAGM